MEIICLVNGSGGDNMGLHGEPINWLPYPPGTVGMRMPLSSVETMSSVPLSSLLKTSISNGSLGDGEKSAYGY